MRTELGEKFDIILIMGSKHDFSPWVYEPLLVFLNPVIVVLLYIGARLKKYREFTKEIVDNQLNDVMLRMATELEIQEAKSE